MLLLTVPSFALYAYSTNTFPYYEGNSYTILSGTWMEYFEDSSSTLNAQEVLNRNSFRPARKEILNFGISNSTYWFRLSIRNNSEAKEIYLSIEQPLLDLIELYTVSGGKVTLQGTVSKNEPFFNRKHPQLNRVFDIPVPPGGSRMILLKVRTASPMVLPVKIGTRQQISTFNFKKELLLGTYSGIMLAMILYNLFVFFSIRDKSYLLYVSYVLFITLTQTSLPGFTFKYLWPDFPPLALNGQILFSCLAGIAALEFIREFLRVREFVPKLAVGIPIFNTLFFAAIVLCLADFRAGGFLVMQTTTALASLYSLFISYKIYRLDYRPAKFFLLAWSILLIGAIVFVLKDFELIPYNGYSTSALLFSSALETLLLSFALADKINMFRKEKEKSQEQAMAAMAEIARIGREQNIILETKVNERTRALKQSNVELNKALLELKEAESQLVESEKMASLGQLTAGIAHEINNPTNFVTSNVKPLKRDINMMIRLLEQIEEIAFSGSGADEKRSLILELKNKLNYDYLKAEVDQLIEGIKEGSNRTAEIIKSLRSFSRLDEESLKKVSLNDGIDSTLIIANHMLEGRIKIEKNYSQLPSIECYPGKLNQVFLNIITNGLQAIKSKFNGNAGGMLTITTCASDTTIVVSFKDNGIGMDKTTQDRIFEPFFTTKDASEGTGLGMSIVYNIIQKHKGKIEVHSEAGKSTEFKIVLPIKQDDGGNQS